MTDNKRRFITFLGISIVLGALISFGTLMASNTPSKDTYTATVLRLDGIGKWDQGNLKFTGTEVLFESTSGTERDEWGYNHLKKIDVERPRLLKITLLSGEHFEFAPFGSEKFDSTLVTFLHNNVKGTVEIKSKL